MSADTLAVHPAIDGCGSHDPGAVLLSGGRPVFGIEEARLVRRKHASLTFPERSIRACLSYADCALSDLDSILVPWNGSPGPVRERLTDVGTDLPPVRTFDHHRSHAASAFFPSGFDEALVLTVDARGDRAATVVWHGRGRDLDRLRTYEAPNSLGYFYAAVTGYLGYRIFGGEGKVMGLAGYGKANPLVASPLRRAVQTGLDYDVTPLVGGGIPGGIARLEELFARPRGAAGASRDWQADLAGAAQSILVETVREIVEHYCESFGVGRVCLAGGVALNCKLNKRVAELPAVDRLFVQPVAHDTGSALGAGLLAAGSRPDFSTLSLGPSFPPATVAGLLDRRNIRYTEPDDLVGRVADLLADGAVVGWFQGRTELGPRALGNRSILADPRTERTRDRVNAFVKRRAAWRPLAPSLLAEAADDHLRDPRPAPFMIQCFDTRTETRDDISAVVHPGDGTTRPQVVPSDERSRFARLLDTFGDLTGVPVLLNTSFNRRGEPIVTTPLEALDCFAETGLDALAIEDFLLTSSPDRP